MHNSLSDILGRDWAVFVAELVVRVVHCAKSLLSACGAPERSSCMRTYP